MSYEFIYEKDGTEKKLTQQELSELAKKISTTYVDLQEARSTGLQKTQLLIDEIFLRNNANFVETSSKNWKTKVHMCKIFMLYQTLKAYIWRNIYTTANAMFDVSGENSESNINSNKQKAAICDVLQKMNFSQKLDKIIDNSLLYGDLVAFVGWKKTTKQVRRQLSLLEKLLGIYEDKEYILENVTTYDNPYIYDVNPINFVFDPAYANDWDSCPKVLKSFKTPEEIMNNSIYTLSKEAKEFLESICQKKFSSDYGYKNNFDLKDEIVYGNTVEILEHWGDIRLPDGQLLNNMHVAVLGRRFIIRFEKNKFVENPFVYACYTSDPDNKYPISPLQCIYDLAMMQEKLYSRTVDMQALNENPPIYAPEGFFNETEIELHPGKIVTYDPNLFQNVPLTPMQFSSDIYVKDIMELDSIIAEVSGIYPNMSGQLDKEYATATEITIKTQGQSIRLAMLLDMINQNLILPIVEKVAALLANFKFENETLFINKEGKNEPILINSAVRQGKYQYTYSDRNSYLVKNANTDQIAAAFEKFGKVIPLDWKEVFKWYWEQKGVDNPERFLQQDSNALSPLALAALANEMKNKNKEQNSENKPNTDNNTPPDKQENTKN